MKDYRVKITLLLLTCLTTMAWAQQVPVTKIVRTNRQADLNWLMGNSEYWMVMNRGALGTVVMKGKSPLGLGGSSVASDTTGNLLFYTDGHTVYDANHTACATCSNLEGEPSIDQPSAICELNSTGTQYAIFTNDANNIKVSVADMTGGLHITSSNQTVGPSQTTGLITVPQPAAALPQPVTSPLPVTSYYAIYQSDAPGNILQVVTVDPGVTANAFTPQAVTIAGAPTFSVKSFAYNEATKMLAITPVNGPVILVKVGANATLTFEKIVPGSEAFAISDSEFSLNGKYLYISKKGTRNNDGGVYRFEVNSSTGLTSLLGTTTIDAGYDLQLAADGNIYHIYQASGNNGFLVGRLTNVDKPAITDVKYSLTINKNRIKINNLGGARFPSFLPPKNLKVTVDFDYAGKCTKSPVAFFPKTTPTADSVNWEFVGIGKSWEWSPMRRFKISPGEVKMTAYYDGETVVVSKHVLLETATLKLKIAQDTTACSCELLHPKNKNTISPCTPAFKLKVKATANGQPATPTYLWSTGATTAETAVDSVGFYYVVATDANGCPAFAGTTLNEYGQNFNHSNYWYFGNKAWINFSNKKSTSLPTPLKNEMNAPEGCNLACDLMGNPIFYTDGRKVWDKKGYEMAANIGGSESTQVEIVQVPGDSTLFYIFTPKFLANGQYEMRYALFDLKGTHLVNGVQEMGTIVSPQNSPLNSPPDQLLFSHSTERIFYNNNDSEGWLVGHESDNRIFRAYKITSEGIGQPRTSAIGTVHASLPGIMREGQIKVADTVLAVAVSRTATPADPAVFNQVDFFYFDKDIGLLNDYVKLNCENEGPVYGMEISLGKTKLYASVRNGSNIYEFLIKYPKTGGISTSTIGPISAQGKNLGAMSYGPDDQLYIAVNGENFLGQIEVEEADKDANGNPTITHSTFKLQGAQLPQGTRSNWGLPTWKSQHQGNSNKPAVTVAPTAVCLGKPVTFIATRSDPMDSITWDLDNGRGWRQFRNKDTVKYTYLVAKTYHPKLKLTNRCISRQGCDKTFIQPLPANSTFTCSANKDSIILKTEEVNIKKLKDLNISNSNICLTSSVILDANKDNLNGPSGELEFLWEPLGKTTSTIEVKAPSNSTAATDIIAPTMINKVTVKDKQGCKAEQTNIYVVDGRPQLLQLEDLPVCHNEKVPDLDVDPHGANANTLFQWKINEVNAGTAHNQPVETKATGEFTYTVKATINDPNPDKQCVTLGKVVVTVNELPKGYLPSRFIICNDPDNHDPATSQVRLKLEAEKFTSYEWLKDDTATGTDEELTATLPGNYQVTYTNEKGCKGTAKTSVVQDCIPSIVAPNAFRPESETEVNRTFSLHSYFVTNDFQIIIYNRWGQKVFESDQRDFKWNGGYQNEPGRPAPGDVYAYVIRYTGKYRPEEGIQEKRGGILLVR